MKTKKEHLQEIIDHYTGWTVSTKGFLKEIDSKEMTDKRREELVTYYNENLQDYEAKIKTIESLMEGAAA